MVSPTYKKLSDVCDTLAPRFKHILSLIPDNVTRSSVSLFDKNKKVIANLQE